MALGMGQVSLRHENGVTILGYDYQAQVSGKLAAVGSRLLEGAIRLVLDQLFRALAKEAGDKSGDWFTLAVDKVKKYFGAGK